MKKYIKSILINFFWFVSKSMRIHSINRMLVEKNYSELIKKKNIVMKKI